MRWVDLSVYGSLLRQIANAKDFFEGKRLHLELSKKGYDQHTFLGNLLVKMYGSCGSLDEAWEAFENVQQRNVFSWNIMVAANAQNGYLHKAREMFERMPQTDVVSWNAIVSAYAKDGNLQETSSLFEKMPEKDVVTWNAIVTANAQNGHLLQAYYMFGKMPQRNVVSLNAMITAYSEEGLVLQSKSMFDETPQRDATSWNSMIAAYAQNGYLQEASRMLDCMPEQTLPSWNAIITAYAETEQLKEARSMFDRAPQRNVVTWSAMVAGYTQNGQEREALQFFKRMDLEGIQADNVTFVSVVDACTNLSAIAEGRIIHAAIVENGLPRGTSLDTGLINMYGRCGSLEAARSVFDNMLRRDSLTWNAMLAAYTHTAHTNNAIELFHRMIVHGIAPVYISFISILSACSQAGLVRNGWEYFQSITQDFGMIPTLEHYRCMVDLLGRAGQLDKAEDLINKMPVEPDDTIWKTLLGACKNHGDLDRATRVASQLFEVYPESERIIRKSSFKARQVFVEEVEAFANRESELDAKTYVLLLRKCDNAQDLSEGKRVHAHLARHRFDELTFIGNVLVQMYGNCGSLEDARMSFEGIPQRNMFSWNIMVSAYARNGHMQETKRMLEKMPHWGLVPWTAVIAAYAQNGHVEEARCMFDRMLQRDVVTWTAMISAYAQNGHLQEAEGMFNKVPHWDVVSWAAMVAAYAQNGHVLDAKAMFDRMPQRNMESWNALVTAYAQTGHMQQARKMFEKMPQRNLVSWTVMVQANNQNGNLPEARSMFETIPQRNVMLWNAMITAYAQNGHMDEARSMFERAVNRNVVSWTAMVTGFVQNGLEKEALLLFRKMDLEGVYPDIVAFISVLNACASIMSLADAKVILADIVGTQVETCTAIRTALVNLYGKCGNLVDARGIFDKIEQQDVVSWTTMVAAYAHNAHGNQVLQLFQSMLLEGVQPVCVTFISIISACSHGGLLAHGSYFFISMHADYGIEPSVEHYRCMVDLLGRVGQLDQAEELISNMPYEPDLVAWKTLLSAYRIHGNAQRAARVATQAFELNPDMIAPYVLLSNIYAEDKEMMLNQL